jgi:hypothetical protein
MSIPNRSVLAERLRIVDIMLSDGPRSLLLRFEGSEPLPIRRRSFARLFARAGVDRKANRAPESGPAIAFRVIKL